MISQRIKHIFEIGKSSGHTKIIHKRLNTEFLDENAESIHGSQS